MRVRAIKQRVVVMAALLTAVGCLLFFSGWIGPGIFRLWIPEARADHWLNGQYQFRKKITLNSGMIIGTLPNFPVLLSFTDSDLILANGYVKNANGYDIIFGNAEHTPPQLLPQERTAYNPATGAITVWVLIKPSLSPTTNEIYMYYGNPDPALTSPSNPSAVWGPSGADYKGVWHLDELGACPGATFSDATGNGLTGTCYNSPAPAAGQINGAQDFTGAIPPSPNSDGINIPSFTLNSAFTYEAWIKPTSISGFHAILDNSVVNSGQRWLGTNVTSLDFYDGTTKLWSTVNIGSFYHVAFTSDGTANPRVLYVNGVASPQTSPALSSVTGTFAIGYTMPTLTEYFAGQIDEVRVSNMARTAAWIQTSRNTQFFQPDAGVGKFISLIAGSINGVSTTRETGSHPLVPVLDETPSFPNRYTASTMPVLGTFSTTDPNADPIEYEIQWDDNADFSSPAGTQNSSAFPANGFSAALFASGAPGISYTIGSAEALANGATYWWRVRARDPGGSGLWSDYSVSRSITIDTTLTQEAWFQTTDAQFAADTLTNAQTTGTGGVKVSGW